MATLDYRIESFFADISGDLDEIVKKERRVTISGKGKGEGIDRTIEWNGCQTIVSHIPAMKRNVQVFLRQKENIRDHYNIIVETIPPTQIGVQNFPSSTPSEIIAGFIYSRFL